MKNTGYKVYNKNMSKAHKQNYLKNCDQLIQTKNITIKEVPSKFNKMTPNLNSNKLDNPYGYSDDLVSQSD